MQYAEDSPFYRLLATRYDAAREQEAIMILEQSPEIARLEWPGPDLHGQPFVKGSTVLHYAANDGKLRLMEQLIECGADVNAAHACWYRSVLAWAANNARLEAIRFLLARGARPDSLDGQCRLSLRRKHAPPRRADIPVCHGRVAFCPAKGRVFARAKSLHAAAWGGSSRGEDQERDYAGALKLLIAAGADRNDRRYPNCRTPLAVALESGNRDAIEYLRSLQAQET
jgi:ankyrin repeat protein